MKGKTETVYVTPAMPKPKAVRSSLSASSGATREELQRALETQQQHLAATMAQTMTQAMAPLVQSYQAMQETLGYLVMGQQNHPPQAHVVPMQWPQTPVPLDPRLVHLPEADTEMINPNQDQDQGWSHA